MKRGLHRDDTDDFQAEPEPLRRRLAEQDVVLGEDVIQELMVAIECSICMEHPASTAFTCGHCFCCQKGCETLVNQYKLKFFFLVAGCSCKYYVHCVVVPVE